MFPSRPPGSLRILVSAFATRLLLVLLASFSRTVAAELEPTKEYQIKAVFLFNFIEFTEWPAAAFKERDAPLQIGVLGSSPFGSALETAVRGEIVRGRRVTVRQVTRLEDLKECQLAFLCASEKARFGEILAALDALPILVVSEVPGFAGQGGVINFYNDARKVRFEINPGAARARGLKVSSQLLSVARIVVSEKDGK